MREGHVLRNAFTMQEEQTYIPYCVLQDAYKIHESLAKS